MGKGIHLRESSDDMIKKHGELTEQISGFTKELTQFYQATIARTQDKRLFVYFKNTLNTINEELPKILEDALQKWWDSEYGLPEFAKRKGQGDETDKYLKTVRRDDLDLIKDWTVSTAILLKLNTGVTDIKYAEEFERIMTETRKYVDSILTVLEDMNRYFDNKYDEAEECYNISKSFEFMRNGLDNCDKDGVSFTMLLTKELHEKFAEVTGADWN